jgi:hypothetical protein
MKLKAIDIEQLGTRGGNVVRQARKKPVIIREQNADTFVVRRLVDDDLADDFLIKNPRFRASLKAAMKRCAAGKDIPLAEVRKRLKA